MPRERLRVFAYDISDNRARRRVADMLQEHAVRIQRSVYEARLNSRETEALIARIRPELDSLDRLRVYCVPDNALTHCRELGGPAIADGARFWLF